MTAIVCEQLTKQFPHETRAAVDHVNFSVDGGHLVVLLGPSGCGKTTLLKMVNRLYEPTGGRVFVEGIEVHDLPVTDLRRRMGYVIQHVGLFPHLNVAQNIAIVPELLKWERARIDSRIDELLDLVRLPNNYRRRFPRQLSGGEQQRVGLARALAADPKIMLMDEPFAALDAINRAGLQGELLAIQQRLRKTILFVTHDVEEALRLADKIIVMHAGKIVQYDTPLEIVSRPRSEFVRELVGTENVLRRLSLMRVRAIVTAAQKTAGPDNPADSPAVTLDDDLRTALTRLLASPNGKLRVLDGAGRECGQLTFDDLRVALTNSGDRGRGNEYTKSAFAD